MNFKHTMIVLKKEIMDIIRDKKTWMTSIILPMLLIPIINIVMSMGMEQLQSDIATNINVGIGLESRDENSKQVINDIINKATGIVLLEVDDPKSALEAEDIRAIISIDKDFSQKLERGQPFEITITYDESRPKSEGAYSAIIRAISDYDKQIVNERLLAKGIDTSILSPTNIKKDNVASKSQVAGALMAMFFPMLIAMFIAIGGIPAALDLAAGEKERGTLEPLLTTRADRMSIVTGKFLTVTLFSFISVIATLSGLVIGSRINPKAMSLGTGEAVSGLSIAPMAIFFMVLVSVLMALMFAGIQLTLSVFSRSFKEASTYTSPLIIGVMLPAYATMFMQPGSIPEYLFALPLINAISIYKELFYNILNYSHISLVLVSSLIYAIISIRICTYMFNRENVLFRS